MNIRKFIAPTAREALRDIRSELGEEAIILSNRKTEQGVELVAMANDDMVRLSGSPVQEARLRSMNAETVAKAALAAPVQAHVPTPAPVSVAASSSAEASILGEIKFMHSKLQKQIETLRKKELSVSVLERPCQIDSSICDGRKK